MPILEPLNDKEKTQVDVHEPESKEYSNDDKIILERLTDDEERQVTSLMKGFKLGKRTEIADMLTAGGEYVCVQFYFNLPLGETIPVTIYTEGSKDSEGLITFNGSQYGFLLEPSEQLQELAEKFLNYQKAHYEK